LSSAIAEIDPVKLSRKAHVEIDVATFVGEGCGSTVSAVVRKGKVVQLKVTPYAEVSPVPVDPALKSLVVAARKKLGLAGTAAQVSPCGLRGIPAQRGRHHRDDHHLHPDLHLGPLHRLLHVAAGRRLLWRHADHPQELAAQRSGWSSGRPK
jgi:hypothetical protein